MVRRCAFSCLLLGSLTPAGASGLQLDVYLARSGLGLLALPLESLSGAAKTQSLVGLLGGIDTLGTEFNGWSMSARVLGPSVVNLGALSVIWSRSGDGDDQLGVRLGVLNTTVPLVCDGMPRDVLRLDSRIQSDAIGLTKIGVSDGKNSVLVRYVCVAE